METRLEKLSGSRVDIFFKCGWNDFLPYYEKAVLKLSKNINIPGFRPGRAPRETILRYVGEAKILAEAADICVKKIYPEYVLKNNLEIIGSPRAEILKLAARNPFEFKIRADVLPELKLPDYKKIAGEAGGNKQKISVQPAEVESSLKWLQQSRAVFSELDRPSRAGDLVEIEYQSPQIENSRLFQDRFVLGKGGFAEKFEKELETMKKGQEKEFTVNFPEETPGKTAPFLKPGKELAGKKIRFRVKMKNIQKMDLPELNDQFAKNLGNFESLADLKKNLKEGIAREKEIQEKEARINRIVRELTKQTKIELPASLLEAEKEHQMEELKEQINRDLKMSFEKYLESIKKSKEEIEKSLEKAAERKIKKFLIFKEIGKKENIIVEPEETEKALERFLNSFPEPEKAKSLDLQRIKEYYKEAIFNQKVADLLDSYANNSDGH